MRKAGKSDGADNALLNVDDKARGAAMPHRKSAPVIIPSWLSEIGDQPQLRTLSGGMIAAGLIRSDARMMRAGVRMLLAHEIATAMKNFVKHRVDRSRPRSADSREDEKPRPGRDTAKEMTSFPSGHSAGSMAVARAFASEYPQHAGAATAAAGAVAAAQVPRCAHYPTDIGAGMIIGVAADGVTRLGARLLSGAIGRAKPRFTVRRLHWADEELGTIPLPARTMHIREGFGSGLARRAGDPPGIVWAVGDRGPNLKAKTLIELYGLEDMSKLKDVDGAKVMPWPGTGPALARLRIGDDRVERLQIVRVADARGRAVSGLPVPGGAHARCEPAFDLQGNPLEPDPSGLDTEGIIALQGGGFWLGDEFGPSLVRLDANGSVQARYVPEGMRLDGAAYPVHPVLPAIAARRHLNRGFEAIALSPDEKWLFLAFQSPLAHPDEAAHEQARHVRLWRLDAGTLRVAAQYLYPLDPPASFRRDTEKGAFDRSDIKVSEMVALDGDRLLVLERGSETTKIYEVAALDRHAIPHRHLQLDTRPTVEELSASGALDLPALEKQLLFSTDDAPEVAADLEGMLVLSPSELLLVNDNDFGVEGAETSFWKVRFDAPVLR